MDVWMDGWMDGWMYVWMYVCMDVCMYVCMFTNMCLYRYKYLLLYITIYIYYILYLIYIIYLYIIYIYIVGGTPACMVTCIGTHVTHQYTRTHKKADADMYDNTRVTFTHIYIYLMYTVVGTAYRVGCTYACTKLGVRHKVHAHMQYAYPYAQINVYIPLYRDMYMHIHVLHMHHPCINACTNMIK